jgi:CRISPR/Cas system endoribonuclease Cas6 (RAMP superfamily)
MAPVSKVRIEFLTPTELKSKDQIVVRPEFPILFGRIRDRVSTLSALYGSGPLPIDFAETSVRASRVRLAQCDIRAVSAQRRSGRTGQMHPIGGFIGSAEYEGELAEFLPLLQAARWTGVGRQTVWGKGEIRLS